MKIYFTFKIISSATVPFGHAVWKNAAVVLADKKPKGSGWGSDVGTVVEVSPLDIVVLDVFFGQERKEPLFRTLKLGFVISDKISSI